jgi:hypothetical protein
MTVRLLTHGKDRTCCLLCFSKDCDPCHTSTTRVVLPKEFPEVDTGLWKYSANLLGFPSKTGRTTPCDYQNSWLPPRRLGYRALFLYQLDGYTLKKPLGGFLSGRLTGAPRFGTPAHLEEELQKSLVSSKRRIEQYSLTLGEVLWSCQQYKVDQFGN